MSKLTLSFKGNLLKYFPLHEGNALIGSDPECDIFIDSLAIQPQHARLELRDSKATLYDLDTADGSFVNGLKISGEQTLKDGDDIRIGKHNLRLTLEANPAPAPAPPAEPLQPAERPEEAEPLEPKTADNRARKSAFLQIQNGANVGKILKLKQNLTHLGTPGVQLAVVARRSNGYFLSHLEGGLPTQVNAQEIADESRELQDGDIIQIGNIRMLFTLG